MNQTTHPETSKTRLTMTQQRIIRDMQNGRPGPRGITNSIASALERRGLVRWHLDLSRGHGGHWELTDQGKAA